MPPKLAALLRRTLEPSFISLHYYYIGAFIIIGSILIYPVRNIRYIDALFFAAGACTQGGLNTVDINTITLWQQIVLYILPLFTNPIFIHSFTVFLRLRWFEKKIDNVNAKSKQQSRIRRTTTLNMAQEAAGHPHQKDLELGLSEKSSGNLTLLPSKSRKLSFDRIVDSPARRIPRQMSFKLPKSPSNSSGVHARTFPTSLTGDGQPPSQRDIKFADDPPADTSRPAAMGDRDIKFADMPVPKRRKSSVKPADMAKSINMMESLANTRRSSYLSDGPALVIKGPRDSNSDDESDHHGQRPSEKQTDSPAERSDETLYANTADDDAPLQRAATNVPRPKQALDMHKRSRTLEHTQQIAKSVKRTLSFDRILSEVKHDSHKLQRVMSSNYVSWQPTIGGNSVFVDLTEEQREELGGVEYRALKLLFKILTTYFVGFHVLAAIMLMAWALGTSGHDYVYKDAGTNPVWWGFFSAASAFNDLGYTLTPNSMMSFSTASYPLIIMSFFIIIGNTGFPCLLHFIIWIMYKFSPTYGRTHESLGFLLDHPRRCFTLLLPSSATWWLFGVLVGLNATDLILFCILDLRSEAVNQLPYGYRVLAGLFQAFCTRTAGFSVIDLSKVHVAVQVSYMVMMYVSVFPVAMSIRRTNVYEEQSLGVYYDPEHSDNNTPSFIATHLRKQLSFDLWFIFLGLFIISIAEGGRLRENDAGFTPFTILFEIVSAYGTVGMSLGYPTATTSFSGQFTTVSKLVIISLLYRGRHRGLPYSLDRAIMLPSEKLDKRDVLQENRIKLAQEKMAREATMSSMNNSLHPQRTTGQSSGIHPSHTFQYSGGYNDYMTNAHTLHLRDPAHSKVGEHHTEYENDEERRKAAASGFVLGGGRANPNMKSATSL